RADEVDDPAASGFSRTHPGLTGINGDAGPVLKAGPFPIATQPQTTPSPPRSRPEPRCARTESALSRIDARPAVVVHQSASAAVDLHVRVHDRHARGAQRRHRAVFAVSVLRPSAVDLVLLV